jgi:hypothetical protein
MTGITDLVTKGIDIALFCLFGSLVWENLGSRLSERTERDRARKSIRAIAKFFFYSLVILIGAYLVDFARDQTWITVLFPTSFLTLFEELMVFGGYVVFVPPLYAIGKVLGDPKKTISDITLPEVSELLLRSLLALFYLALLWAELVQTPNMVSRGFEVSLIVGLLGILLTFAKFRGWKGRAVPWLTSCPWIVLLGVIILSMFHLI